MKKKPLQRYVNIRLKWCKPNILTGHWLNMDKYKLWGLRGIYRWWAAIDAQWWWPMVIWGPKWSVSIVIIMAIRPFDCVQYGCGICNMLSQVIYIWTGRYGSSHDVPLLTSNPCQQWGSVYIPMCSLVALLQDDGTCCDETNEKHTNHYTHYNQHHSQVVIQISLTVFTLI